MILQICMSIFNAAIWCAVGYSFGKRKVYQEWQQYNIGNNDYIQKLRVELAAARLKLQLRSEG